MTQKDPMRQHLIERKKLSLHKGSSTTGIIGILSYPEQIIILFLLSLY